MKNPDEQDTDELHLSGRIEPHPLARDEHGYPRERSFSGIGFRVRCAPNPDGASWRTEDNQ